MKRYKTFIVFCAFFMFALVLSLYIFFGWVALQFDCKLSVDSSGVPRIGYFLMKRSDCHLIVKEHELEEFYENIEKFKGIKRLSIKETNTLSSIDPRISILQSLKSLNIEENNFSKFPVEVTTLKNLEHISFSRQASDVEYFPKEIANLKKLKSIYLNGNNLTILPSVLLELQSIEIMELSNNQLDTLPENIGKLSTLTVLDLSDNVLTELPASFARLNNLKNLNVKGNNFGGVPEEIIQLKNLTRLYITYDSDKATIARLKTMESLEKLNPTHACIGYSKFEHLIREDPRKFTKAGEVNNSVCGWFNEVTW